MTNFINNSIESQWDPPFGPVIAGIFMVELETTIVPTLSHCLLLWRRYVDDTLCFVKKGYRDIILAAINNFHPNINFTFEEEVNNMLSFLDILLIRQSNGTIERAVFRKQTNSGLYINWNAFAPDNWKIETLKLLVRRAHRVSNKRHYSFSKWSSTT